jgi:hypothetical protein
MEYVAAKLERVVTMRRSRSLGGNAAERRMWWQVPSSQGIESTSHACAEEPCCGPASGAEGSWLCRPTFSGYADATVIGERDWVLQVPNRLPYHPRFELFDS